MTRDLLVTLLSQYKKFLFANIQLISNPRFVDFLKSFVLKMNSLLFSDFFQSVIDWTNEENSAERFEFFVQLVIYFFDILNLFFVDYFSIVASMLITHNYSVLLPSVLGAFKSYFDLNNNDEPADWVSGSFVPFLVVQLKQNPQHINSLINCCVSFGKSVEISSELWRSLHDLLIADLDTATVSDKCDLCLLFSRFFECWNEEYLVFLPSLLPVLADLLDDSDEQIEHNAKQLMAIIEKYLGEPLMKYLE